MTKINTNATGAASLVYSTYLATQDTNEGNDIAVDSTGNAYVVGLTRLVNEEFPTTPGAFQDATEINVNSTDTDEGGFLTKLNPTGTALVYSTYIYSTSPNNDIHSASYGVAVDNSGQAYVTGYIRSIDSPTDFPTTSGAFNTTGDQNNDSGYVLKFNTAGSSLVYGTFLGGTEDDDEGYAIAVDNFGNAYVTGDTASTDFPRTTDALDNALGGFEDAFLTILNPSGSSLLYSSFLGGTTNEDQGYGIALDRIGNVYVAGRTFSTDFPITSNAFDTTAGNLPDGFLSKFLVDSQGPNVVITAPLQDAVLRTFPAISGTVQDNFSDVTSVQIAIQRGTDGFFFNGGTFQPAVATLPATLNGNNFTYTGPLPSGAQLTETFYNIYVGATDAQGNLGSDSTRIVIDLSAPSVSFTQPVDGAAVTTLTAIAGIATDNGPNGPNNPAGVTAVNLTIRRISDGLYFNGSGFSSTRSNLSATLDATTGTFRFTSEELSGLELQDGQYRLEATATDVAGNSATTQITVTLDRTKPVSVEFDSPRDGALVSVFPAISGTVLDANSGSISRVVVSIIRNSDGLFFNGSGYTTTPTQLPTSVSGTRFFYTGALPQGAALTSGSYTLIATAFDAAGNSTSSSIRITLDIPGGPNSGAPTVSITSPVGGRLLSSIDAVTGIAQDNAGGSGIARVDVAIFSVNGGFYNGTRFVGESVLLPATLSGGTSGTTGAGGAIGSAAVNFRLDTNLGSSSGTGSGSGAGTGSGAGSASAIPEGVYQITAFAYDARGNVASSSVSVSVDARAPTIRLTSPSANAQIRGNFPAIAGVASDGARGSGVTRVEVTIQNAQTRRYFNGTSFNSTSSVSLSTSYTASTGVFVRRSGLPSSSVLTPGRYVITAKATDAAGKTTSTSINVYVPNPSA